MSFSAFSLTPADDYLIFFKGYNSVSSLVPSLTIEYHGAINSVTSLTGGGLLYVSRDEGVATIDFGPRFLTALHAYAQRRNEDGSLTGIGWNHISAVAITHYHIDHWADLPSLLSLFSKLNNRNKKERRPYANLELFASEQTIAHLKKMLTSTAEFDSKGRATRKFCTFYTLTPDGVRFRGTTKSGSHLRQFPLVGSKWTVTRTEHMEVRNKCTGVGFVITLPNKKKVGITGDTAYSQAISNQYIGVNLLILNIGDFEKKVGTFPMDQHMKLLGAKAFIEDVQPEIAIITEFDSREAHDRLSILKELRAPNVRVFAGDVGLTVRLSDFHIRCDGCGRFAPSEGISQIFFLENETADYRIQNFCRNCSPDLREKARRDM